MASMKAGVVLESLARCLRARSRARCRGLAIAVWFCTHLDFIPFSPPQVQVVFPGVHLAGRCMVALGLVLAALRQLADLRCKIAASVCLLRAVALLAAHT